MVQALLGSDLKACMLEATRTWHVQHEFSDCRCDIVFIRYKDNFLTRGATKIKSTQFSEFGSRTQTFITCSAFKLFTNGFSLIFLRIRLRFLTKIFATKYIQTKLALFLIPLDHPTDFKSLPIDICINELTDTLQKLLIKM